MTTGADLMAKFNATRSGASGAPELTVDFTDPAVNKDPYPVLRLIRELGPVAYNPLLGLWMLTGYRPQAMVLSDYERFGFDQARAAELFGGLTMEALDPPEHTGVRAIWSGGLERHELDRGRSAMIRRIIVERMETFVERLRAGEVVDAMPGFTRAIPALVIGEFLGVPASDLEQFTEWSYAIGGILEGQTTPGNAGEQKRVSGVQAVEAMNAYVASALEERRRQEPGDDFISVLAHSHAASKMPEEDQYANLTQFLFAGHETTAVLMATALIVLAQHPDQRRAIVENRALVPRALEEIHRWQSIVCINLRFVRDRDGAELEGVAVPGGSEILCLAHAANRDPARWENPDEFNILRPQRAHIGYGFGPHVCVGINLARLETQIWLNELLDRVPDFHLATDEIDYGTNFIVRAPKAVPISL